MTANYLLIETKKFPILPEEADEVVNDGMVGKALCLYLQSRLPSVGIESSSFCAEDWGWWLEVRTERVAMALCIYADPEAEGHPERYVISPSITKRKKWSWSKLRMIDVGTNVDILMAKTESIFRQDPEISSVTRHEVYPL